MFLWFIYQFRFKLYSKSLALVLLLLPFSCFTCSYHYCWSLDLWPNWYPLTVPVRPLWKHEQLRRAGLTELIFRLFCQGETTWIRESVSTCAGLQLPLLMIIFCFLLVYFVLCPDHSLVVNFKSCFVLLLKFCFLNGVFFVRWSKGVLYATTCFAHIPPLILFLSLCCPCLSSQF